MISCPRFSLLEYLSYLSNSGKAYTLQFPVSFQCYTSPLSTTLATTLLIGHTCSPHQSVFKPQVHSPTKMPNCSLLLLMQDFPSVLLPDQLTTIPIPPASDQPCFCFPETLTHSLLSLVIRLAWYSQFVSDHSPALTSWITELPSANDRLWLPCPWHTDQPSTPDHTVSSRPARDQGSCPPTPLRSC